MRCQNCAYKVLSPPLPRWLSNLHSKTKRARGSSCPVGRWKTCSELRLPAGGACVKASPAAATELVSSAEALPRPGSGSGSGRGGTLAVRSGSSLPVCPSSVHTGGQLSNPGGEFCSPLWGRHYPFCPPVPWTSVVHGLNAVGVLNSSVSLSLSQTLIL